MSKGQHNIVAVRTDERGNKRWHRVGTAFPLKNGKGFNLILDSLPTDPEWNGHLVMKPSLDDVGIRPPPQHEDPPPFPDDQIPDWDPSEVDE